MAADPLPVLLLRHSIDSRARSLFFLTFFPYLAPAHIVCRYFYFYFDWMGIFLVYLFFFFVHIFIRLFIIIYIKVGRRRSCARILYSTFRECGRLVLHLIVNGGQNAWQKEKNDRLKPYQILVKRKRNSSGATRRHLRGETSNGRN